jgi:hypothetical protein
MIAEDLPNGNRITSSNIRSQTAWVKFDKYWKASLPRDKLGTTNVFQLLSIFFSSSEIAPNRTKFTENP